MTSGNDSYGAAEEEEISLRKRKQGGKGRRCRKVKVKKLVQDDEELVEVNLFTQTDLLGVGGDFRYAVGGGRLRRGGGGSVGGTIWPRVRGRGGRSEDGGTEGRQDGGQNIQVFTGRLSTQRVWI